MNKYKDMMDILHKEASDLVEMNLWHEQLHKEHPKRVRRMIRDAADRTGVSLKDQIYDILMGTEEIQTCREDWCEIKAKKIAKLMEGE